MERLKWIIYIIKNFLGMLSIWQLDHAFSKYVWEANVTIEIARFFTIKIEMWEMDFWILCIFIFLLALFLPELYELAKIIQKRINTKRISTE